MEQSCSCGRRIRSSRPGLPAGCRRRGARTSRWPREHLIPSEIDRLVVTAKERGRWGQRDAAAILLAYSHGFRVSELVALTWAQIDFKDGVVHVLGSKTAGIRRTPCAVPRSVH